MPDLVCTLPAWRILQTKLKKLSDRRHEANRLRAVRNGSVPASALSRAPVLRVTTFALLKHANSEMCDEILMGRRFDPGLTVSGDIQARALAERLSDEPVNIIQCSPRLRARRTAETIAHRQETSFASRDELDEIEIGDWSGRSFVDLADDPQWRRWNSARHLHIAPGGESMLDVQRRIVGHMNRLRYDHPNCLVLLVSHDEVIRCALLYYLGLPLSAHASILVSAGAISRIQIKEQSCHVLSLNERITS